MTRDEHRAECIEAMRQAMIDDYGEDCLPFTLFAVAAFDSLHGIARVNPVEATGGMVTAGLAVAGTPMFGAVWRAMSAAGDLTNPPEGKP
jgi:hypothetical protein